jgi:uncharacterized membrane protein
MKSISDNTPRNSITSIRSYSYNLITESIASIFRINILKVILPLLLALLLIQPAIFSYAETTYSFHGTVLDQEGKPLPGVNILAYDLLKASSLDSQGGYYVTTVTTGSDGSYRIPLYIGSFTLIYEKSGYVKQTRSLQFTNVMGVELGPTTLDRSISITFDSQERIAAPGSVLTVPFTVANGGDVSESVGLQISIGEKWAVNITDAAGEIAGVTLQPGESANLSLLITIPFDAKGETMVNVTATGIIPVSSTITVQVTGEAPHLAVCQYPSRQASPGAQLDYAITVSNPNPYASEETLEVKGLPTDWNRMILNADKAQITSINLPGGGSSDVTIHVEVPQTVAGNSTVGFEVQVSLNGRIDSVPLSVEVQRINLVLGLKTKYPTQNVELGNEISFPITLENPGETEEVINLSTEFLPTNWACRFTTAAGGAIQSILLEARERQDLNVVFKPDIEATPANYRILVKAESSDLQGELTLQVGLTGSTSMKMVIGNLYGQLTVGDAKDFEVKVENTGYSTITFPRLQIDPSVSTIMCEYSPLDVNSIPAGGSVTFSVKVTALEGTAQGDYMVELKALSREVVADPVQIRLTVQASSSQTLIVVVVVAAALASVFVVYRKFKRR